MWDFLNHIIGSRKTHPRSGWHLLEEGSFAFCLLVVVTLAGQDYGSCYFGIPSPIFQKKKSLGCQCRPKTSPGILPTFNAFLQLQRQLPDSPSFQPQTATAGPCRPHPLSQSNKFPFTTYIHSIRPVPLENLDQYSSFFKRPTSSLLFPKDAL